MLCHTVHKLNFTLRLLSPRSIQWKCKRLRKYCANALPASLYHPFSTFVSATLIVRFSLSLSVHSPSFSLALPQLNCVSFNSISCHTTITLAKFRKCNQPNNFNDIFCGCARENIRMQAIRVLSVLYLCKSATVQFSNITIQQTKQGIELTPTWYHYRLLFMRVCESRVPCASGFHFPFTFPSIANIMDTLLLSQTDGIQQWLIFWCKLIFDDIWFEFWSISVSMDLMSPVSCRY